MTVPCQVSTAEMREAFRLNLNSSACFKILRGNARSVIYILVFSALIIAEVAKGGIDWQKIAVFAGGLALFVALFWFRFHRTIAKTAKVLSASCSSLTIDTQGLTAETTSGTRTSVPWSAITCWREGKLVFTIGDAKAYRTVPKTAMGEMQSGELRSLLLSQIRANG
ncbi:MAG: YcxB family protein [Acidobacteriota bacterium]|nr:YcxB family protein [Acidobacteriota bacterium]